MTFHLDLCYMFITELDYNYYFFFWDHLILAYHCYLCIPCFMQKFQKKNKKNTSSRRSNNGTRSHGACGKNSKKEPQRLTKHRPPNPSLVAQKNYFNTTIYRHQVPRQLTNVPLNLPLDLLQVPQHLKIFLSTTCIGQLNTYN